MNTEAAEKLSIAKAKLVLDNPFFASLVLSMPFYEDAGCPTMYTDGERFGYNPDWILKLTLNEKIGVLVHEVMHCIFDHMIRRNHRDAFKWNIAADYVINPQVVDAGFELPKGILMDRQYVNMTAEDVFDKIPDPLKIEIKVKVGCGAGGEGDGNNSDPGGCGEIRDAGSSGKEGKEGNGGGGQCQADKDRIKADWARKIVQAHQVNQGIGKIPAEIDRLVKDLTDPKVDWRIVLWQFIELCAKDDYRWSPPNRRHVHNDMYLPSFRSESMKDLVIAIDTSGSIDETALKQFLSEVNYILTVFKAKCHVIYCDAEIKKPVDTFEAGEEIIFKPKGGGGTDFRPPFRWVDKHFIQPSCFIYFTDMCCYDFPQEEPFYPVLWAKWGNYDNQKAPFGKMVEIKEK